MLPQVIFLACPLFVNVVIVQSNKTNEVSKAYWLSNIGVIGENLLKIQAFIIKDEEISQSADCRIKSNKLNASNKRYFMCSGSILSANFVLTSASCLHEATYIRHNVKGLLAAMISPFTDSTQIIKIVDYTIHPHHQPDSRDINFAIHNIGVAKLSCRIAKNNLFPIRLPTQPLADLCQEDNCTVAVVSKITMLAFNVHQTNAKNVFSTRLKRQFINDIKILNETANKIFNFNVTEFLESNKNNADIGILESIKFTKNIMIDEKFNKVTNQFSNENSSIQNYTENKKISIRSTDGQSGCAPTGSAVMLDNIQGGLVAMACDDRQSDSPWQYTDLFDNLLFIKQALGTNNEPHKTDTCGCSYNFFFDSKCSHNVGCPKVNEDTPECPTNNNNNSGGLNTHNVGMNKLNASNQAFEEAVRKMYLNNNKNRDVDDDNKISKINSNSIPETFSNINTIESKEARLSYDLTESTRNSSNIPFNNINPSDLERDNEIYNNRRSFDIFFPGNNDNYREEKAITNQRNFKSINEYNFLKENKKSSIEDYFKANQYEESNIPAKYLILYRKFLDEQKKQLKQLNKKF